MRNFINGFTGIPALATAEAIGSIPYTVGPNIGEAMQAAGIGHNQPAVDPNAPVDANGNLVSHYKPHMVGVPAIESAMREMRVLAEEMGKKTENFSAKLIQLACDFATALSAAKDSLEIEAIKYDRVPFTTNSEDQAKLRKVITTFCRNAIGYKSNERRTVSVEAQTEKRSVDAYQPSRAYFDNLLQYVADAAVLVYTGAFEFQLANLNGEGFICCHPENSIFKTIEGRGKANDQHNGNRELVRASRTMIKNAYKVLIGQGRFDDYGVFIQPQTNPAPDKVEIGGEEAAKRISGKLKELGLDKEQIEAATALVNETLANKVVAKPVDLSNAADVLSNVEMAVKGMAGSKSVVTGTMLESMALGLTASLKAMPPKAHYAESVWDALSDLLLTLDEVVSQHDGLADDETDDTSEADAILAAAGNGN